MASGAAEEREPLHSRASARQAPHHLAGARHHYYVIDQHHGERHVIVIKAPGGRALIGKKSYFYVLKNS